MSRRRPTPAKDQQVVRCVAALVAIFAQQPTNELLKSTRGPARCAAARLVLYYILQVEFGWDANRTGIALKRDRTTIAHGVRKIHDVLDNTDHYGSLVIEDLLIAARRIKDVVEADNSSRQAIVEKGLLQCGQHQVAA